MKSRTIAEAAGLCSLLASPTRSLILLELGAGPRDTTSLAEAAGCSQPHVSNSLRELRMFGLVETTRAVNRRVNTLTAFGRLVAAGLEKLSAD